MKKLVFIMAGTILGLIAVEIFIRLTFPLNKEFYLGLNNKYGLEIARESNSLGFRDREHPFKKATGVKRILVVGDSIAAGWGVRYNEMFARLLEKKLKNSEVILLAQPGWDTMKEISEIKELGMKYNPDLIIIAYFLNDPMDPRDLFRVFHKMAYRKPQGINKFLFDHFAIFRFLWKVIQDPRVRKNYIKVINFIHTPKYRGWRETVEAFNKLREITEEKGIPVIVILFPSPDFPFKKYPFSRVHKRVESIAKAEGFIFVDLLPYLKNFRNFQLTADRMDRHPNRIVHRISAEVLYDIIQRRNLLK